MASPTKYPPAPDDVPSNFTKPSSAYRLRTLAVLGSLFLFLLLYLAMIAGIAALIYWLINNFPKPDAVGGSGRGSAKAVGIMYVAYFGAIIAIAMLLVFLVKGLFKSQTNDRSQYYQIERSQHPELFSFIDRICMETAAPKPAGVFISADVNAAVFYDTSLINLIIPPKKYLLIGAGLVNSVGLREFKAVLAHEFGHFSQKSLSLSTYVYVANRIMADIVYRRDKWDDILDVWCQIDIRLSFPAWGLKGVVWVLRKILGGVFQGINLLQLSLSRQMEFNADDVAVSVAGSDAIVTTLCKVEFADQCFAVAAQELITAADHDLLTADVFHHQRLAADYIRKKAKKPTLGIPPAPPERVFSPDDHSAGPAMWSSHPPNHEREENAKRIYFPVEPDLRSPWILFSDPEHVRKTLSKLFYRLALDKKKISSDHLSDPEVVQAFIESERAETSYDPKYHGLFDDRILRIGDYQSVNIPPKIDPKPIAAFFRNYPPHDLEETMTAHQKRQGEASLLSGLSSGQLGIKGKSFEFRDRDVSMNDVPKLLKKVNREMEEDFQRFEMWDRRMYENHYIAAHHLDPARANDLRERYRFQMSVQHWITELNGQFGQLEAALTATQGQRQLTEDDFRELSKILQRSAERLEDCHIAATRILCPDMSNIVAETKMSEIIRNKDWKIVRFSGDSIDGEKIGKLVMGYQSTLDRLRRLFFKGMGNILTRQEAIAAEFMQANGATTASPA